MQPFQIILQATDKEVEVKAAHEIRLLKDRIAKLEHEDQIGKGRAVLVVLLYVFFSHIAGGLGLAMVQTDDDAKWDLAAYTLPVIAAAAAGFGLFRKAWLVPAFWISVALLWAGYACYLMSKHMAYGLAVVSGGVQGVAIALFLLVRDLRCQSKRSTTSVVAARSLYSLLGLAALLVAVWGFRLMYDLYRSQGNLAAAIAYREKIDERIHIARMVEPATMQPIRNGGKCSLPWVYEFPCVRAGE
ncbi:hypothetical protein P3W24_06645 [Luteibacter sp. PPL201]|uniref:Uncharacterized protein n=1 Tax=Luteibacter sahnii TaxID=3021977 RepID=A0ABT6B946_9GAMM